jgi:hypothetical protein
MGETKHNVGGWSVVIQQNQKFDPWTEERVEKIGILKKIVICMNVPGRRARDAFAPCGYSDQFEIGIICGVLLVFM